MDLLKQMLLKNPEKRISAIDALSHAYFQGDGKEGGSSNVMIGLKEALENNHAHRKSLRDVMHEEGLAIVKENSRLGSMDSEFFQGSAMGVSSGFMDKGKMKPIETKDMDSASINYNKGSSNGLSGANSPFANPNQHGISSSARTISMPNKPDLKRPMPRGRGSNNSGATQIQKFVLVKNALKAEMSSYDMNKGMSSHPQTHQSSQAPPKPPQKGGTSSFAKPKQEEDVSSDEENALSEKVGLYKETQYRPSMKTRDLDNE